MAHERGSRCCFLIEKCILGNMTAPRKGAMKSVMEDRRQQDKKGDSGRYQGHRCRERLHLGLRRNIPRTFRLELVERNDIQVEGIRAIMGEQLGSCLIPNEYRMQAELFARPTDYLYLLQTMSIIWCAVKLHHQVHQVLQ